LPQGIIVQNLTALWGSLDARRRIIVIAATVAMFAAVLGLSRMASTPGMALLYSGLDAAAAGEVVAALEQRGVAYRVQGGAIEVDAAQRDELRMTLAAEGLPAAGAAGYELLDQLSGFGTTAQMFDAAYWRAKEGELARTILSIPQVRAARVHIARADPQPFRSDGRPTASVTVTSAGGGLAAAQAKAIKHLVAAAVAGMVPEDVSVIDSTGGLILSGDEAPQPALAGDARALELKRNVERLLAARVGPGKAIVEVAVDVVTEHEEIAERRIDPESRVVISTDTEERSGTSSQNDGEVTVASNLPEGDAAGGGESSQNSETRERMNFEVSETTREVIRAPGSIRRISVAVLVDGVEVTAADGSAAVEPRSDEELAVLRDLVASAVGFDEARGDVITLRSLTFEPIAEQGTLAEAGLLPAFDLMSAIQIAALALVALVLGLFVVRPVLAGAALRRPELPAPGAPLGLPGVGAAAGTGAAAGIAAGGAAGAGAGAPAPAGRDGLPRILDGEIEEGDLPQLDVLSRSGEGAIDPVARLRRLIEERQAESIEILRGWMEDREERT
jgi:flagellar M-ring protein FliF